MATPPFVQPVILQQGSVTLVPLNLGHADGLRAAAQDGELWTLRITSVPAPDETAAYIQTALQTDNRLAFAVTDTATGEVLGSTSYHDIVPSVKRVEIGYTWYAARCQRTHVNTTAKLLLMTYAFETLGCHVVGWRTDNFNFASQKAIERLGAQKDGVLRGHALRRDGTIRDTVMYSMRAGEWPEAKAQLVSLLNKPRKSALLVREVIGHLPAIDGLPNDLNELLGKSPQKLRSKFNELASQGHPYERRS